MVKLNKITSETLHFFLLEISQQLLQVEHFFRHPSTILADQLFGRSGYSANLYSRIQNTISRDLGESKDGASQFRLKAIATFAQEMHTLIQLARQSVKEIHHPHPITEKEYSLLQRIIPMHKHAEMIQQTRLSVESIESILHDANAQKAIKLGKKCTNLQGSFQLALDKSIQSQPDLTLNKTLSQALFSISYIRQILELMKHISDTVLSISIGQKMNHHRYHSLSNVANEFEFDSEEMQIETVAETRSGSAISGIRRQSEKDQPDSEYLAIFKEGEKKSSKKNVKVWKAGMIFTLDLHLEF
ncbi:hypothetical protein O1D97_09015 [Marinomonas sp. 15G1-11]|uniref:Uncharacterized protein n=1 Tax=Marinomonas phaeophyticola TaxID=3004091 RepID=A0ABT4JUS2_9GAMM|nr:hypothetical protein [Marinomonas sp. 15G1-11]MCZ2721787.1 hypothetical protein [Marinomonas sp. 15G1-11]